MVQLLKKMALKNKFFFKKLAFFSGIGSGLFGLALKAYAIFDTLATSIRIALEIITWSAIIFGASFAFVYTSNAILGWVTTPGFIRLRVRENPLVLQGWQVTRDFVNLFFILVVIWIGISIALRIGEGQAKKALPRLVIVALLINFTPVICGVIIDASNIVMNFFLSAGTAGNNNLLNISSLSGGILLSSFEGLRGNWFDGSAWSAAFFQLLFVLAFNFIAGIIMLLMAVLLIIRHVALWILVILAPLAFFAWIFPGPGFRKIWNMWWKQFIQWCFVGVGAGFFLFLTQVAITNIGQIANIGNNPVVGPSGRVFLSSLFTQLIIYSVPLVLLLIGIFATIQSAPMGAEVVTKAARKQMLKLPARLKKAGGWGAKKVGERWEASGPVTEARARLREKARKRLEQKAQMKPFRELSGAQKVARVAGFPLRWAREKADIRRIEKGEGALLSKIQKDVDRFKNMKTTEARLAHVLKTGAKPLEKLAGVLAMFEKGEMKKVPERLKREVFDQLPKLPKEIRKNLIKAMPDVAESRRKEIEAQIATAMLQGDVKKVNNLQQQEERLGLALSEEDVEKGYRNLIEKVVGSASPKDIEKFDEKLLKSPEAQAAIHKFWTGREVSKAVEKFGKSFLDLFQEGLDKTGLEWYQKNNPRLYRYLRSNAAQNLGLEAPLSEKERKEKNIPLPSGFHGGKQWAILTDEEKETLKKEFEARKNPESMINFLAEQAGFEALTREDVQRLLRSPMKNLLLGGPEMLTKEGYKLTRKEREVIESLREMLRQGGYRYLSRRGPAKEEIGEFGMESPGSIKSPEKLKQEWERRRHRRPPEEEV